MFQSKVTEGLKEEGKKKANVLELERLGFQSQCCCSCFAFCLFVLVHVSFLICKVGIPIFTCTHFAAVTNNHKYSGLMPRKFIVLQFWTAELWNLSSRAKFQGSSGPRPFLEPLGDISVSFPAPEAACIPWPVAPFHLQSQPWPSNLSPIATLGHYPASLLPFRDPCEYIQNSLKIQQRGFPLSPTKLSQFPYMWKLKKSILRKLNDRNIWLKIKTWYLINISHGTRKLFLNHVDLGAI